jgi:hypothetical protein
MALSTEIEELVRVTSGDTVFAWRVRDDKRVLRRGIAANRERAETEAEYTLQKLEARRFNVPRYARGQR